jgi:23S rRNA (guanosine2251-2'-O)-methyltransferase
VSARAGRAAERRGLGGDIVPGVHAVRALLRSGERRVRKLLVADERAGALDEIVHLASERGVRVQRADAARVRQESRVESSQGVVAIADAVEPVTLGELLSAGDAFVVAFDGVTDPRNLGAVLRTAEAAGATGAIVTRHRGTVLTPAAVKAAAGAVERVPIALVGGAPGALEQASRAGVWTVGLDAGGDGEIFDLELADRPLVLVLGAEGAGLARLTRQRCDVLARIPMHGSIESLNVSAAAAVACFEIARRRH